MSFRRIIRRGMLEIVLAAAVISLAACRDMDAELDADMKMEVIDDDPQVDYSYRFEVWERK